MLNYICKVNYTYLLLLFIKYSQSKLITIQKVKKDFKKKESYQTETCIVIIIITLPMNVRLYHHLKQFN